jgi:hypothetical protein
MTSNIFLYFIVFIGIFLSSIAGLYSISGLIIIFKGNIIATTLMAVALEISKVCISIYIHVFWKKANKLLLFYLTFALVVLMMITSAGVYSYLSKSYMTSTDTDVIYEKIKLVESQIDIEKEKIKNKQEEMKTLRTIPVENRDNGYYWRINGINTKITEYTANIEKMTDSITPLKNKVLEINMEIGPLKYISLLLYQSEGKAAIDKSVQVFIGIVVMVFDPLAILLIFSGIHGLHKKHAELEKIKNEIMERKEKEKERRLQIRLKKEDKIKKQHIFIKPKKEKIENETEENKSSDILEKITLLGANLEEKINKNITSQIKENSKELEELKETINIIVPKNDDNEEEQLPDISPPPSPNLLIETINHAIEKNIIANDEKIADDKKVLKIKKKKENIAIDEKEIIPPLIKNRPKKIKKNNKNEIEEDEMMTKKEREHNLHKEKKIDYLYNGERQEDYLIKYEKKKKSNG